MGLCVEQSGFFLGQASGLFCFVFGSNNNAATHELQSFEKSSEGGGLKVLQKMGEIAAISVFTTVTDTVTDTHLDFAIITATDTDTSMEFATVTVTGTDTTVIAFMHLGALHFIHGRDCH